ncbi:hypothetical protein B0H14DRAFT_2578464 [Mycena olivaceomarginata]|nr:hypothetical protein B0H14DRAFT_2578464 [Mycena olivaceomarginata]
MSSDDTIYSDDQLGVLVLLSLGSDTTVFDSDDTPTPKTLSEIEIEYDEQEDNTSDDEDDTMTDVDNGTGGQCSFCGSAIEAEEDMTLCRFFRCTTCESGLQCESCCVDAHATHPSHPLEASELVFYVISHAGEPLAVGTLICQMCTKDGLLCKECCVESHTKKPLHTVQRFTKAGWEQILLRELGFIYQIGHEEECQRPEAIVLSLLVINIHGTIPICLQYCGCAKFDPGEEGHWQQIIYNGWHPLLNHIGGQDTSRSQITGDCAILILNDSERQTNWLDNISHKRRRVTLNPDALDDALAKWVPINDSGHESLDLNKMDSISGASTSLDHRKKHKLYKSSDDPMSLFPGVQQIFLNEPCITTGSGTHTLNKKCTLCQSAVQGLWNLPSMPGMLRGPALFHATALLGVLHITGIHKIRYRFCGCDHSDKVNNLAQLMHNTWYPASFTDPDTCTTFAVSDFFRLLNVIGNRLTDATAGTGLKWLPRLHQAGRGHDPAGITATKQGECIVTCWACPYDGRNLPANWHNVDPKYWFLFRLIIAMDTNFKMKNRIRAREHDNPLLGPGWGAFVELTKYKKHLQNYVGEKDVHFILSHIIDDVLIYIQITLAGFDLLELTLSYDIACQMEHLPERIRLDLEAFELKTGLPVWHALAHEDFCASMNSLNYILGVGCSDGEGVERLWAFLNGFAYQSKEMGLGNCADTIEDKLNSHNFLKNLGQAFKEINKNILSETRAVWQAEIDTFTADRTASNPYILANQRRDQSPTLGVAEKEEQEAAKKGQAPLHAISATAFLAAGLQLEETQCCIKAEFAAGNLTADWESKVDEHCLTFVAKLRKFCAVRMMQKEEIRCDPNLPAPSPEHIKLWLPSELSPAERTGSGCQQNIVNMEVTLSLTSLKGEEYALHLKLLKASNITLEGEEARDFSEAAKSDQEALKRMARIGGRLTQPLHNDTSAKTVPRVSWIWLVNNGLDISEEDLHECKCFPPL